MKTRILCGVLSALAALILLAAFGCQSGAASTATATPESGAKSSEKTYTIGVCQLVQHEALDAATQGFCDLLKETLGDRVSFVVRNASGDSATCSVICGQFVGDEVDLIMANATPALQAAQSATNQIPILATSITDYAAALGLENFDGATHTNISGTSDRVLESEQVKILNELFPDAKNIGILYCSSEANSKVQADAFREAAEALGYTVTDYKFADSNDVAQVAQGACDACDVLYIPTDNTAASNAELINNVALNAKTPIVAGEEGICRACGVATLTISYYELGRQTGSMAIDILEQGADVSQMPIAYASFEKKYNPSLCSEYGITVSDEYLPLG